MEKITAVFVIGLSFAVGLMVGIVAGRHVERTAWKVATIERGFAQYDSQTGAWEWKETDDATH